MRFFKTVLTLFLLVFSGAAIGAPGDNPSPERPAAEANPVDKSWFEAMSNEEESLTCTSNPLLLALKNPPAPSEAPVRFSTNRFNRLLTNEVCLFSHKKSCRRWRVTPSGIFDIDRQEKIPCRFVLEEKNRFAFLDCTPQNRAHDTHNRLYFSLILNRGDSPGLSREIHLNFFNDLNDIRSLLENEGMRDRIYAGDEETVFFGVADERAYFEKLPLRPRL